MALSVRPWIPSFLRQSVRHTFEVSIHLQTKPLIGLSSNVVAKLIMRLIRPASGHAPLVQWSCSFGPMVMLLWSSGHASLVQWSCSFGPVVMLLWSNGHAPFYANFWSCSIEFLPFPGLWLVEQFLCICRQTADRTELKFGGWTHCGSLHAWLNFSDVLLGWGLLKLRSLISP